MTTDEFVTERFEQQRPRLRGIAYRMLGSLSEADDAVQETWLRLARSDAHGIDNLDAWLTAVLARVCLNVLRARSTRAEEPLDGLRMPDPVVDLGDAPGPEARALVGESVGLALLVVLDRLGPDQRLAFVLHDIFGVPFADIATLLDATPPTVRQLASRARRRVGREAPTPDPDPVRQRDVVDAFLAAAHEGDFDRLVAIMHPDVVLRSDGGTARPSISMIVRGARRVAEGTRTYGSLAPHAHAALVNGVAGVVVAPHGTPFSIMAFTVVAGRIAAIDVLADPERLAGLGLAPLAGHAATADSTPTAAADSLGEADT